MPKFSYEILLEPRDSEITRDDIPAPRFSEVERSRGRVSRERRTRVRGEQPQPSQARYQERAGANRPYEPPPPLLPGQETRVSPAGESLGRIPGTDPSQHWPEIADVEPSLPEETGIDPTGQPYEPGLPLLEPDRPEEDMLPEEEEEVFLPIVINDETEPPEGDTDEGITEEPTTPPRVPDEEPEEEEETEEVGMGLQWWPTKTNLQPFMREWGGWLRELVEGNPMQEVPFPFQFGVDEIEGDEEESTDEGEEDTPTEGTHVVVPGDTMSNIANRNGVPLSELIEANPQIQNPNLIYPGQEIIIPGVATEPGEEEEEEDTTEPSVPGYSSTEQILREIRERLGLSFSEEATIQEKWQTFVNTIPSADLQTQQLITSLAIDPETEQWYTRDVAQLVNPKYL